MSEGKKILGIKIVLMSDTSKMSTLWLPVTPQGRHYFDDCDERIKRSIYIEARENKWIACCSDPVDFWMDDIQAKAIEIKDKNLFRVRADFYEGAMYAEFLEAESQKFQNYVANRQKITIGRSGENDIVYYDSYISRYHASLIYDSRNWMIRDENSTNHIYVNGKRVSEKILETGDSIYILGLRILVGIGFFSINSLDERIFVNQGSFYVLENTENIACDHPKKKTDENRLFNRFPRRRQALLVKPIEVEGPPMSLNGNKIPMFLRMGSSMVMGGSSALMGNYTMLLTSVLFPLMTQKYTDKEKAEYEKRRVESYTKYLHEILEKIYEEKRHEEKILCQNYPALSKIVMYTTNKRQLWERRKNDDDFLMLRVGSGRLPLRSKIDYPQKRFEIEEDALEDKLYEIVENNYYLDNVPIMTSLLDNYVCGVTGEHMETVEFIKKLVIQLTVLHSYDEVKTIFLLDPKDLENLSFIRYLPHAWNDQRNIRFIAVNNQEVYQISEYLKNEIEADLEKTRDIKEIMREHPYYVVFALSKKLFDSMEVLKNVMQFEKTCGVSIITVFDELPKECFQVFEINRDNRNLLIHLKEIEREDDVFAVDELDETALISSAKILANTKLKLISENYTLPKSLSFLEMFGVGRIEHLNPLKRWRDNNPVMSLATPIGVATDGTVFTLDLHQKSEGPHGLVAGMTGSGKSEFILTYILSMALNYHPDEVAFILIDYKGGGLAGAFENPQKKIHLPHVAGTITNLDGSAIQRSMISIESELRRRQRVFNEVKNAINEGTMDIYLYQKLYRQGVVHQPMPHLFIISDEFAELKQQAPEFMEQLISTARIGRSLGVHLILATQKPSGVVNDQILSNTKFRVCLKVQDRSDSMDMLKRPEAADLVDTGRFYLQVGYNEHFALGQSAWSGAPYEPQDYVSVQNENMIRFVDHVGQTIIEVKEEVKRQTTEKSQLVEVVQMLSDLADQLGLKRKKLWCEPLPGHINIKHINQYFRGDEGKFSINTCFGMLDDPKNQRQMLAVLDFVQSGNVMLIGPAQSGKSSFLQTVLCSLADRYTPEQLNFYVMDYSNRALAEIAVLPHCGIYLTDENEDKISSFFEVIDDIMNERKELFSQMEVTSYKDAVTIKAIPLVLIVIDNITGLNDSKAGHEYVYHLQNYLKEGANFGIRYILTSNHSSDIPQRIKLELRERIALCMADRYEYMEILPGNCEYVPPIRSGKGLYALDGELYEIQIARYYPELSGQERSLHLKKELDGIREKYSSFTPARGLVDIPENEKYEVFAEKFIPGRIPLGYNRKNGKEIAIPFRQFSKISVYFGNLEAVKPVTENLLYAVKKEKIELTVLKKEKESVFNVAGSFNMIEMNKENLEQFAQTLLGDYKERADILRKYCMANNLDLKRKDIYKKTFEYMGNHTVKRLIIIEDFALMSDQSDEGTSAIFERLFEIARKVNVYFIAYFYPGILPVGSKGLDAFHDEKYSLLFSGELDAQPLVTSLQEVRTIQSEMKEPNHFIMEYRKKLYSMVMPCGESFEEQLDVDEVNIFE